MTLHLTGSGSDLGIATAVRLLPLLALGPVARVIADRYDKRRLLFFTQTASAFGSAAFAVLTLLGAMTYPLLLALSLLLGCLTVLDNPAHQSLVADLVDRPTL